MMISGGVFMLIYWVLCRRWLETVDGGGTSDRVMLWLGVAASVFLVLYSTALGNIGEAYHVQRRIGVTGYFGSTFMAQLLLARRVWHLARVGAVATPWRIDAVKIGLCIILMALGLTTIPVSLFVADHKAIENVIEWNFAILVIGYYLTTPVLWRASGFRVTFVLQPASRAGP